MFTFKILIVEDDEAVAQAEASKLRGFDLDVKIVTRGDDAIPVMRDWMPHLVVLDLHLPGQSGVDIQHHMRMDPVLREILVITNSSHMDPKGSLGMQYYGQFVIARQQEPMMIDKLKPHRGFQNNLVATVAVALGEKFQATTPKLRDYLDGLLEQKQGGDKPTGDF